MMEALWNSCSSLPLDYLDLVCSAKLSAVQRLRGRDNTSEPSSGSTRFLQYVLVTQVLQKNEFNELCEISVSLKGMNLMVGIFSGQPGGHIGSISVKGRTTRSHSLSLLRTAISAILWHWDEAIGKPTGGEGAVNLLILSHFKKILSRCPPAQ